MAAMSKALKDIAKRAETWPEKAQEELVRAAREIEEEYVDAEHLSPEERKARGVGAVDSDNGRCVDGCR
jgi:hypothetical protein